MTLNVEFTFDSKSYRHYMNGFMSVLHCHHYMTLVSKAAMENKDIGGINILVESTEDSVRPMFDDYITKNKISDANEKLNVGAEYYSVMGMGKMSITGTAQGGEVELSRSHVDQGWLMKFGKSDIAVNHFTRGYIAAVFAAAFGTEPRNYSVTEVASIVKGDPASKFIVTKQ